MIPGFNALHSLGPTTRNYGTARRSRHQPDPAGALIPQWSWPWEHRWGNWCGSAVSGPGGPIDDLDACCQRHDNCYGARGGDACSCDNDFRDCISKTTWGGSEKNGAYIDIWSAFQAKPCDEAR